MLCCSMSPRYIDLVGDFVIRDGIVLVQVVAEKIAGNLCLCSSDIGYLPVPSNSVVRFNVLVLKAVLYLSADIIVQHIAK